jgi:glutathione S-transferase
VWAALEEKGLDYHWVEVDPYKSPSPSDKWSTKTALSLEEKWQR